MVIDVLSSVVPTPEAFGAAEATLARLRGYQQHFTSGDKVPLVGEGSELRAAIESSDARGRAACPTQAQFDGMLDDAGVSTAVVYTEYYETSLGVKTVSNDVVADYVARDPGRLLGLAGVDPWKDDAVSETQRALTELGLRGIVLSPFKQRLDPSDARMARIFSVCEELGAPVFLHTGINWWVDTTYEIGHPRHIDALASSFPNLKIVALHCGWPWVEDMMMVAWRHANVYLDISAHRPKHMTIPDSGWSPLLYWGNRMLSSRVVFGSTWTLIGMTIKDLADEVRSLPLKDEVIERWLHGNAERLLGLG
jgi:predicted TIM-barrel fold metal-dependent hydrolase